MKKKAKKSGGARPGSGPKLKYGEETIFIGFRVPKSKMNHVKKIVFDFLNALLPAD